MSDDLVVRPATADDRESLVWLEGIARDGVATQRGGDLWLDLHPVQSPAWPSVDTDDVLVATFDDVVVAYLRFHVDGGVLYVDDVFVHPDARELGGGDALLAAAIDVGIARDARRIEAEALPGDRLTKNLYERAGITAKRIIVSSPIGDA